MRADGRLRARVFAALGRPELVDDERFATATAASGTPRRSTRAIEVWAAGAAERRRVAALTAEGVPATTVRDTAAAVRDPRLRRGETMPLEHPAFGALDDSSAAASRPLLGGGSGLRAPPPRLGEHNDFVYGGSRLHPARLASLRENGAI